MKAIVEHAEDEPDEETGAPKPWMTPLQEGVNTSLKAGAEITHE